MWDGCLKLIIEESFVMWVMSFTLGFDNIKGNNWTFLGLIYSKSRGYSDNTSLSVGKGRRNSIGGSMLHFLANRHLLSLSPYQLL